MSEFGKSPDGRGFRTRKVVGVPPRKAGASVFGGKAAEPGNAFAVPRRKPGASLFGGTAPEPGTPVFGFTPDPNKTVFGHDRVEAAGSWEQFVSGLDGMFRRQYGKSFEEVTGRSLESLRQGNSGE